MFCSVTSMEHCYFEEHVNIVIVSGSFFSLVCFDVSGEEGFDEIRFAAYRTAAKLLFIQNRTNCE